MGYLFGIAAIILLYSIRTKPDSSQRTDSGNARDNGAGGPNASPLPDFVRKVIEDAGASKPDLLGAAEQAQEAGYPKLALALKARADGAKQLIPSPWKEITDSAWTRFCSVIADGHKAGTVNPKGFFGIFQLGVRRLVDLGIMANPKSRNIVDPSNPSQHTRIWEGRWVKPQEQFLSDPQMQYKLFVKSMELYRNIISEKYSKVIGLDIDGKPATLSGLLALAHTAGSEGMHKWLTTGSIRNKFTWVTEAYHKTNGIF
jgi:hypothetical protein